MNEILNRLVTELNTLAEIKTKDFESTRLQVALYEHMNDTAKKMQALIEEIKPSAEVTDNADVHD